MATATLSGVVIQVQKKGDPDISHYHARIFFDREATSKFTLEYRDGNFELHQGMATEREKELLIHCIQALELAGAFP
jgi:hypothetical protein